ncbi:MAG: hypothetical protein IKK70_01005 [Clostridia bacterium]|nr:hypothetical protein [Clostridia bacterium]
MKKLPVFVFLCIFAISLTSCGGRHDPKDKLSIPLSITVTQGDASSGFTAIISDDLSEIRFESEHIFSGTVLRFSENGNTASVGELFTREVKDGCFPAQEALCKAIRLLNTSEEKGESVENRIKYTIDEMTIIVYYDKDSDAVIGIETEESGRRFDFRVVSLTPYEAQSNGAGQS